MTTPRWHKSFHAQIQECKKTGNRFIVENPFSPEDCLIACHYFKTFCHSGACHEMRKEKGIGGL